MSENIEAERAAFEAWASTMDHGYASCNGTRALGNWYYFENDAQAAWAAWQASAARRAAQPADVGATNFPDLPQPAHYDPVMAGRTGTGSAYTTHQMRQYAREAIAHQAAPAQPSAAPKLPEGWIPLSIVYNEDMDHPEEVAYGPPVMMNRLGKWLDKFLAQEIAMRDGMVLVPHYRGYAHLGIGAYILNHSAKGEAAELVISVATEAEKAGRTVGDLQDNAPDAVVQPEAMAVRLRFENVAGLDALEQQLAFVRSVHFPDAAAPTSDQQAGAVALEAAARIAESFGPNRPIVTSRPSEIVRGRWEGEQAASKNIASAIRALKVAAPAAIEQAGAKPLNLNPDYDAEAVTLAHKFIESQERGWGKYPEDELTQKALLDALTKLIDDPIEQAGAPFGYKLVPLKYTPEMRAAWDRSPQSEDDDADFGNAYAALLNAAPSVEQAGAQPVAQADQDALDAKRYRWLRAQPFDTWKRIGWNTWGDDPAVFPIRDEDIDSAMAATPVTDQPKQENQQ